MKKPSMSLRLTLVLVAASLAALVAATSLVMPVQSAQVRLPPRPTPHEDGWNEGLGGATIELRVRFDGAQQAAHWQELWTVVEWQDAFGAWHEVEGWRGTLDEMVNGEGRKVWWVSPGDLSKGPFRWTVYQSRFGGLLAHSDPFNLPGAADQTIRVNVALGAPEPADLTPGVESVWGVGGPAIELRVRLEGTQQAAHWQELWTVVEWQDAFGAWHEVQGWRGTLDEVVNGEGRKVWWVSAGDLGKGPFRWRVYRSVSGGLLAQSEAFPLPDAAGQRVRASVTLEPYPQ